MTTNEYSNLKRITPLVESLHLEILQARRLKSKAVILHKTLNHNLQIQKDNLIKYSERHKDENAFLVPYARTKTCKNSFFPSAIRTWNGLPEISSKTTELTEFKSLIDRTN